VPHPAHEPALVAEDVLELSLELEVDGRVPGIVPDRDDQLCEILAHSQDDEAVPEWTRPLPDLLTSLHVAAALGTAVRTARAKLTDGTIPSRKLGRQRYTRKEDFLALFRPERR